MVWSKSALALALGCLPLGALSLSEASQALKAAGIRDLKAATRRSDVLRRGDDIRTSNFADLLYADGDNREGQDSVFFSRVRAQSNGQVLLLEDIEHLLERVDCTGDEMELEFQNADTFAAAKEVISKMDGGYVIASHAGCSEEGAREPFQIEAIETEDDERLISLTTEKKRWREAFQHFNIEYGYSQEHHELRRHAHKRRQDQPGGAAQTTQPPASSSAQAPTKTADFFSHTSLLPANKTAATATSVALNLASKQENTTFGLGPFNYGPNVPISIGCRLCQTTGTLNLTQGEWEFDWPDDVRELDNVFDAFSAGYVQMGLHDFSAYIQLHAFPSKSGGFTYPLFTVPVAGFRVPGLGTAGIMFEPALTFGWTLSGGLDVSYGFDLKIPHTVMTLNFTDLESSSMVGLHNYTLEALPFQANESAIEMQLNIALRPRIELAFGLFDDDLLAEAGTYLDLPITTINISQLSTDDYNATCDELPQPASNATANTPGSTPAPTPVSPSSAHNPSYNDDVQGAFEKAYGNMTHIAAEVDIGAGVDLRMRAAVPLIKDPEFATSWSLASMPATTLPTACLAFRTGAPTMNAFVNAADEYRKVEASKKAEQGGLGPLQTGSPTESGAGVHVSLGVSLGL